MRIRQALAVLFLVALCGAVAAGSASAKSSASAKAMVVCLPTQTSTIAKPCTPTPRCASGQKSTTAKPCLTAMEAQLKAQQAAAAKAVAPAAIDPANIGSRKGNGDAVTVISFLDIPRGLYRLSVSNTSALGYINTFNWHPPEGMTLTRITSSQGGKCTLVDGNINCRGGGKGIAPPKCTCETGGELTVDFEADGLRPTHNGQYWTYYGVVGAQLQILTMTPVPYHIPSFRPEGVDLPLCKAGQVSTKTKPCTKS